MKIKFYTVTYKNNLELNNTLLTFMDSGIYNHNYEINIINNSIDIPIVINERFNLKYRVIENNVRPTFSTGHLSRNWNECLIDGFKDVNNPDCDIVILCQNDTKFNPDIINRLIESHNKYSFIQNGVGDSFHSYTIDAIKKVGLWDERFCNIGFQEGDYLLRQAIFNKSGSSISDYAHLRFNNKLDFEIVDQFHPTGFSRLDVETYKSITYHYVSRTVFDHKWGTLPPQSWDQIMIDSLNTYPILHPQYIMYPYFEDKFALNNPNYIKY